MCASPLSKKIPKDWPYCHWTTLARVQWTWFTQPLRWWNLFGPPLHLCQCGNNKLKNCNSRFMSGSSLLGILICVISLIHELQLRCIWHGAYAKCMCLQNIIHVTKLFSTNLFYKPSRLGKNCHWNSESCSCRKQSGIFGECKLRPR